MGLFSLDEFLSEWDTIGVDSKAMSLFLKHPEAYEGKLSQWKTVYKILKDEDCPYDSIDEIQEFLRNLYKQYMREVNSSGAN